MILTVMIMECDSIKVDLDHAFSRNWNPPPPHRQNVYGTLTSSLCRLTALQVEALPILAGRRVSVRHRVPTPSPPFLNA